MGGKAADMGREIEDMSDKDQWPDELYRGLRSFVEGSFPKRCANCGRVYASADDFVTQTQGMGHSSGLKQSIDDDSRPIVELFRNCLCGSTLLGLFDDRRDMSGVGEERRAWFAGLIDSLEAAGLDRHTARQELLKLARGEDSALLWDYLSGLRK